LVIESGSVNQLVFIEFFRDFVLPYLPEHSVVIMDNAKFHLGAARDMLLQMLESNDCTLILLPPYSPDLNPIENFFGTVKAFIKRDRSSYWRNPEEAILNAIALVTEEHIRGWYSHCGYL
jgi:transposase